MEYPKRLYVIQDAEAGTVMAASEDFGRLPAELLSDGVEIGVYKFARSKRVQVTRRLVSANPAEPDEDAEDGQPEVATAAASS